VENSSTVRSADTQDEGSDARGRAGLLFLFAENEHFSRDAQFFQRDKLSVGRDPGSDIRLDDSTVSRNHAEIVHTEAGWAVRDLGSRNGVTVDGERSKALLLKDGCIVRFGDILFQFVERQLELHAVYRSDGQLRGSAQRLGPADSQLGGGWKMDRLAAQLERVAKSELTVLLLGESGTGKEVAAREVHRWSRRSGRFTAVNCAAIPAPLLESELFGYRKGAFSGATNDKPGLFQSAKGGTLLLDEIGDMPAESQAKLLRVLQSRSVTPLGAVEPEPTDVRVLAATHRDLKALQESGVFRPDLYARLSDYIVRLPPLRERKEDILALALRFLHEQRSEPPRMSVGFVAELLEYDWPYNVRELESCIKRSVTVMEGNLLRRRDLPEAIRQRSRNTADSCDAAPRGTGKRESVSPPSEAPSEQELRALLSIHRGNVSALAREFGKARMQVHRWLSRYALDPESFRCEGSQQTVDERDAD
jgi:transcriptional regulator with GAF, ATPase, and Fis domain